MKYRFKFQKGDLVKRKGDRSEPRLGILLEEKPHDDVAVLWKVFWFKNFIVVDESEIRVRNGFSIIEDSRLTFVSRLNKKEEKL